MKSLEHSQSRDILLLQGPIEEETVKKAREVRINAITHKNDFLEELNLIEQ
jgi:hypothetical protein